MARPPREGPIEAHVVTVAELFSGDYRFRLPWFQRAYAWRADNAGRLLTNLLEAMRQPEPRRRYQLGTILLARPEHSTADALVDGHQRVMTLTIIFAVLRDLIEEADWKRRLGRYIASPVDGDADHEFPHLIIDAGLSVFVHTHVQQPGGTANDPPEDLLSLSETERNIIENRDHLRARLGAPEFTDGDRQQLSAFLAERCRIVVHEMEDEEEAWQSLQIEEDTRLDFNASDRCKSSIISPMSPGDRETAGRIWEDCQKRLGADDMRALLDHIRNIALPKRSSAPLESELIRHFRLNEAGLDFMRDELEPAAERLLRLRRKAVGSGAGLARIARHIEHLSWLCRPFWIAPALCWMQVRGESGADTETFFALLERLAWLLRIAGVDPSVQQTRMFSLIKEIQGTGAPGEFKSLRIEPEMKRDAIVNLAGKNFHAKQYSGIVLRRIGVALGSDPGPIDGQNVTVEHVLPRGAAPDSQWLKDFGKRKPVEEYVNRLGNLGFLTEPLNQDAASKDFLLKRAVFERSSDKLIEHVLAFDTWTPDSIDNRTRELTRVLLAEWGLAP